MPPSLHSAELYLKTDRSRFLSACGIGTGIVGESGALVVIGATFDQPASYSMHDLAENKMQSSSDVP